MCRVLIVKVLNTPDARVLNFQGYTRFTYFCKYDRVLNMRRIKLWKGSEYFRIVDYGRVLNMPGQGFTGSSICLRF